MVRKTGRFVGAFVAIISMIAVVVAINLALAAAFRAIVPGLDSRLAGQLAFIVLAAAVLAWLLIKD